jgi:hypothetical protein
MSAPVRLRYVVLPNRFLTRVVQRGLFWFALTALLVPALWILAGLLTPAHDVVNRIGACSGWFGFAGVLAWATWHTAYEVIVERDEVRWRGFAGRGRAPLGRLRRIRESPIDRNQVEFDFGRLRRFKISPAGGLAEFVERLQAIPRTSRRSFRPRCGEQGAAHTGGCSRKRCGDCPVRPVPNRTIPKRRSSSSARPPRRR